MSKIEWLESENDEPMLVQRIHKNRVIGAYFNASNVENMDKIPLRDDDILMCSYPKSGCHWVWENIRMLLAGEVIADSVEKEQLMMELFDDPQELESIPTPRLLNNHGHFDEQPKYLLHGRTKLVLVYRNPKDVCVSSYYHYSRTHYCKYKGKFCDYIHRFLAGKVPFGSCLDYWKMWEQGLKDCPNIPYLLVRYEDLHQNPISERRRLASFLECRRDEKFLKEVEEATRIENMRQLKGENSLRDFNDKEAILYRKGTVGDWKTHFTVDESDMFDEVVADEMRSSRMFKFVYSLD